MAFNWEDDEKDDFRDIPDEVRGNQPEPTHAFTAAQVNPQPRAAAPQPVQEELPDHDFGGMMDDGSQDEEEDYEAVLADANLRIDIASLYKMVMNHDLFTGLDVDERAIETVQKQIRKFAKERMEIMLGMRQESPKEAIVSSPFNDLEVLVLKKIASQMSKGATETAQPQPAAKAVLRKEGLNTISSAAKKPAAPKPVTAKKSVQALTGKPSAPVQRQPKPAPSAFVPESAPLDKPINQMTPEELAQRDQEIKARQAARKANPKAANPIPMPSPDQEETFHTHRVATSDNPLASSVAVTNILAALNKK